ncbi:MAG: hypothetical protein ACKV0T_17765 [Planctomycetales bacterium]
MVHERIPPGTAPRRRWGLGLLTAWFVLSVSALLPAQSPAPSESARGESPPAAPLLVVLIGGMDSDPTPAQIARPAPRGEGNSGLFQLQGDLQRAGVQTAYFNWNGSRAGELKRLRPPGTRAIAQFVRSHLQEHPADRVALVGNSWGGHTALEAAGHLHSHDEPVAVNLAIFLDASSAGRAQGQELAIPVNVNRVVQFHTRNLFVWGPLARNARIQSIDLGDPEQGFIKEGRPAYDSPFDFKSHVAAEWDERIHADIARRLLELVPQKPAE